MLAVKAAVNSSSQPLGALSCSSGSPKQMLRSSRGVRVEMWHRSAAPFTRVNLRVSQPSSRRVSPKPDRTSPAQQRKQHRNTA
jgi:hypothetical protein